MLLLTLSAAIYGMITFGMSNFYLTELNKSLEKELDTTIEQISTSQVNRSCSSNYFRRPWNDLR